jgi:hypothetical protein
MPMTPATAPHHDVPTVSPVAALREFLALVHAAPRPTEVGAWRWSVRRHLVALRDVLSARADADADGWLASRGASVTREGEQLLERLRMLSARVIDADDLEPVRHDLQRLGSDIGHHLQRRNDLAWDEVEQEYGGSE